MLVLLTIQNALLTFHPCMIHSALTKLVLPEGFPAHPHSGFDTVTYCIEGGLRHRDSEGVILNFNILLKNSSLDYFTSTYYQKRQVVIFALRILHR